LIGCLVGGPCRHSVVSPIIDVISDETFEYITGSDMTWGGFNWKLNFRWYPVPQREVDRRHGDRSLPLRSFVLHFVFFTTVVMVCDSVELQCVNIIMIIISGLHH